METKDAMVLKVAKDFPVTVEELYTAWITPDDLKQWWHPMNNHLKEVQNDVKEGGSVRYVFENKNNEQAFIISGQYEEVKEKEQLVYSWNWQLPDEPIEDSQFKLRIEFTGQNAGSRLEVTQENFRNEEALQPHHEGWNKALDDLFQYITSKQQ